MLSTVSQALTAAVQHHQAGRLAEAERIYQQVLRIEPANADALQLLGVVAKQSGNPAAAVDLIRRAIAIRPQWEAAYNNLGAALEEQGKLDEALACYQRALQINPDLAPSHKNLAGVLTEQGKLDEAVIGYQRALQINPDYAEAYNGLGHARVAQGKLDEAVTSCRRALQLRPDYAEAHNNLGHALGEQGKLDEAVISFRRALQIDPDFAKAYNNLGHALEQQGNFGDALACFQRALQINPLLAEAHLNLGNRLKAQEKLDEAVLSYQRALQIKPDYLTALVELAHQLQYLCRWDGLEEITRRIVDTTSTLERQNGGAVAPFSFLALDAATTPAQQFGIARSWADRVLKRAGQAICPAGAARAGDGTALITLGYLSADFRSHAVASLVAELFERHDRGRFRVFGYSYGPDDGSPMRTRLAAGFDRFVDIRDDRPLAAAEKIAADGVDILVDLQGYTQHARTEILAHRPAPIQVNYLGYPGTMGAEFVDYIIVDDVIVPSEQQSYFTERLVRLPDCYQVNDSQREIAAGAPSRAECGLPAAGVVFCCFNNSYKITPQVFQVWMRLLAQVPGSVLWLLENNRRVPENLRQQAKSRGVDAERLIFAPRLPMPQHLARHRRADLFLDTLPYNAHTTASDALWAGLPLLTCMGRTFAARVAGSLLRAVGLPELMTHSLDEYERTALRLARNPDELKTVRSRLAANRNACPLFNCDRFARHLEKAYETMFEIHRSGEPPTAFRVDPID